MNRKEKIKLLKGLSKGQLPIQDLGPKHLYQVMGATPDEHEFYINKKRVSREEFHRATMLDRGNSEVIVILPGEEVAIDPDCTPDHLYKDQQ